MARRRRLIDEEPDDDEEDEPVVRPRGRRGRKRWRLALVLVALAVAVVTAPTIIAKTPLRNVALAAATPAGVGTIACTDAVLSWTGGQGLAGVSYADATGAAVFTAEKATVNRSLVGLASSPHDLGTITLTRPVLHVETRDGGSNLEDVLQAIAAAAAPPSAPSVAPAAPTTVAIEIVDGVILGRDRTSGQQWRVDGLALTAKPSPDGGSWEVTATGAVTPAAGASAPPVSTSSNAPVADTPGRFKLRLHAPPVAAAPTNQPGRQQLELVADRLPLAPLEPWLARVLPAARLTGDASADLSIAWTPALPASPSPSAPTATASLPHLTAAGTITAAAVRFTADALSGDLVELPAATVTLDAALAGRRLTAKNCAARGDGFDLQLDGEFDLDELRRLSLQSLPVSDASLTARVDLPQLTRMLPRTLRLRPGVRVDAGSMEITARSAGEAAGRRWTVAAAVQDLAGSDGVRPIRWTAPVEVGANFTAGSAGPQLERVLLRSTFATATADGTAGGLEGEFTFNLEELGAQLGQFVDLAAWRLRGTGEGEFSWRDTGPDRFAASASLNLKQIDVARDGQAVWQDPEVHVEVQASGARDGLHPRRVELATLTVRGPGDTLTAELLEPVDLAPSGQPWSLRLTGGRPARPLGRPRAALGRRASRAACGQATLTAQLRAGAGSLHVTQSDLNVENFQGEVGAVAITEPRIKAAGDFQWNAASGSIASEDFQLTSSTVAAARGASPCSLAKRARRPPAARSPSAATSSDSPLGRAAGRRSRRTPPPRRLRGPPAIGQRPVARHRRAHAKIRTLPTAHLSEPGVPAPGLPVPPPGPLQDFVAWNEPRLDLAAELAYTAPTIACNSPPSVSPASRSSSPAPASSRASALPAWSAPTCN